MLGHIGPAPRRDITRRHHPLAGRGQVAIPATACGHLGVFGFADGGDAPNRQAATPVSTRKEIPVAHGAPKGRVGDVVGGQREPLHAEPDLTRRQRLGLERDRPGVGWIVECDG